MTHESFKRTDGAPIRRHVRKLTHNNPTTPWAKRLVIEWVDPKDPKFRQLAGLNEGLYGDLDAAQLERLLQSQFRLVEKLPLPCETRILYLWER